MKYKLLLNIRKSNSLINRAFLVTVENNTHYIGRFYFWNQEKFFETESEISINDYEFAIQQNSYTKEQAIEFLKEIR